MKRTGSFDYILLETSGLADPGGGEVVVVVVVLLLLLLLLSGWVPVLQCQGQRRQSH
jgi:hypothetical protein